MKGIDVMNNNTRNNEETKVVSGGGCGLSTVLGIIFIVLKLTGVISWSWVWVLAPFWIPLALVAFIVVIIIVVAIIRFVFNKVKG